MEYINKKDIVIDSLPGRGIIRAVGKNSEFYSSNMTVGYAIYSEKYGEMEPHSHAEETVIITKSINGYVSWGNEKNNLTNTIKLYEGMVLHIKNGEWHKFHYDESDGMVEIIYIWYH